MPQPVSWDVRQLPHPVNARICCRMAERDCSVDAVPPFLGGIQPQSRRHCQIAIHMTISFEHEAGNADDAAPGAGLAKPLVATRISYSANLSALLRLGM